MALAVGVFTLGAILFDITLNQAMAIVFSFITITIWSRDRLSGLISALIFFMSKSFWVRLAFALEGAGSANRFDLLGVMPALLLAGLIIWQMFIDLSLGKRLCSDRSRRLMMAFAAISLVTILYCGSPMIGLGGFERNILPNMMILFLGASIITEHEQVVKLLKAMMVFATISTIYAIGQFALGLYPWEQAWFYALAADNGLSGWLTIGLRGIEFRIFSIFFGYMDFFFTNVLIFALAYAYRSSWNGAWKKLYRLYAVAWFAILILSLERMPIVMMLIVFLAAKYLRSSKAGRRKIAFASLAIGTALYCSLLVAGPVLKSTGADKLVRMAELANPFQATSILDRAETKWLPALETIASNPMGVGIGYGSQTKASEEASQSGNYVKPHNELIQKTLETGIVGGGIYLLLMLAIFKVNLTITKLRGLAVFGIGMASATLAFWACGMVNLPFSGSSGLLFWLLAGAVLGLKENVFKSVTLTQQVWEEADTHYECQVQSETIMATQSSGR
jgi:hypothetical protein